MNKDKIKEIRVMGENERKDILQKRKKGERGGDRREKIRFKRAKRDQIEEKEW